MQINNYQYITSSKDPEKHKHQVLFIKITITMYTVFKDAKILIQFLNVFARKTFGSAWMTQQVNAYMFLNSVRSERSSTFENNTKNN